MASHVIFVDARIGNLAAILSGLPPDSDWYLLNPDEDGIEQMRRALADRSALESVQIISHGAEGTLFLGSTVLDAKGLAARARPLAEIGAALSDTGDMLLYGCDVGQGEAGQVFIAELARLTGADVAASSDSTGAAALGGNWTLEMATGAIEAAAVVAAGWNGLLAASVSIAATSAFKPEGLTGTSPFTFTVIRSGDSSTAETVDWTVTGAGPHQASAADFVGGVLPSGTVSFAVGETSKTITVMVQGDGAAEPREGFTVTLSNGSTGVTLGTAAAGATIIDGLGAVFLASIDPVGTQGNESVIRAVISRDGSKVAFSSDASNLVPNDTNAEIDIFVKDLTTGDVTRASTNAAGEQFDQSSNLIGFLSDGTKVLFASGAAIYVKDLITGAITLAVNSGFLNGAEISPDDSKVTFVTDAALVPGDTFRSVDVFVADLATGAIRMVSTNSAGEQANSASFYPAFSPDGTKVVFGSAASNLVIGDSNGQPDVFIKDLVTGVVTLASTGTFGEQGNAESAIATYSPDGSKLLLTSLASNFVAGDTNFSQDLFVKNLATGAVVRVSTDAAGGQANDSSWRGLFLTGGTKVLFSSDATNLVPGDTNGVRDLFVKDLVSGAIVRVSTGETGLQGNLASSQYIDFPDFGVSAGGGRMVFLSDASNLVGGDVNGFTDVFVRSLSFVSIAPDSTFKPEGTSGTTAFTFTLTREGDASLSQSVDWTVAGAGPNQASSADFVGDVLPFGTVTFAVGETSKTITVNVRADLAVEPEEGFTVTLSNATSGLLVLGDSASATIIDGNGVVFLASVDAVGTQYVEAATTPALSGDGSKLAFIVDGSIFIKDLRTGVVTLASANAAGEDANNIVDYPVFSPDGTKLAFQSVGTNLVPGEADLDLDHDIFVKDLVTGGIVKVSTDVPGGVTDSRSPVFSPDGSKIAFASNADNILAGDASPTMDVFVRDLVTGSLVRVSADAAGVKGNGFSDAPVFSPDGTKVVFFSSATNLVAGDTNGWEDIFLKDLSTGAIQRVSVDAAGAQANGQSFTGVFSPDGTKVAFHSGATNLIAGDTNGRFDVFVKDLVTGAVMRVSTDAAGGQANGHSSALGFSPDGSKLLFFSSASNLVAGDTNGKDDIFIKDLASGVIARLSTGAEGQEGNNLAFDASLSSNGSKLAFASRADNLVAGDTNGTADIFLRGLSFVSATQNDASKAEGASGGTIFAFTLTRSGDTTLVQSVGWSVSGSGLHGAEAADFGSALPSGRASFAAGETSKTIEVSVSGDGTVEFNETFALILSNPTDGLLIFTETPTGTIENDDKSVVSIAALSAAKPEGNLGPTEFTFTVSLDQAGVTGQSVGWSVSGPGAHGADATDFGVVLPSGTVTFAAGELSRTLTVAVSGDGTVEFGEDFTVTLSSPSADVALGTSTAGGTIQNDDRAVVSIAALSVSKPEGSSGATPYAFEIRLDQADLFDRSVGWSVIGSGVHAADAADFVGSFGSILPSGTVTFAAGETSKVVTVLVAADSTVEFDEGFAVTLASLPPQLVAGTTTASGTIVNDDLSIASIFAIPAARPEGNDGTTAFTFVVQLDQAGVEAQSVTWSVAGSGVHAADAADFGGVVPSGTLSFAAGETSKTVTVLVSGDATVEFDEGFAVSLSAPSSGIGLGTASATAAISNDDRSVVSIAALSAVHPEGDGVPVAYTFAVSLDQAGVTDLTVSWSVLRSGPHPADGSEFGGGALPGGTVTFAAGETSKVVTIFASGDTQMEFDESFAVILSTPSVGLVLGVAQAVGTIENDDAPVVSIAEASAVAAEGNSGLTAVTFTLTLDRVAITNQAVGWSVAGSGADAADAADFGGMLPGGVVWFAAGETSKTVTVFVAGDATVEPDEGFAITLVQASAGLVIGTASAGAMILNDDKAVVSIAPLTPVQPEGQPLTFVVSLDQASVSGQSVSWSLTGSGAHAADAADFGGVLPSGTLFFAAGETSKLVTVGVSPDSQVEFDETFAISLSGPSSGLSIGTASTIGTIQDNGKATVAIAALSAVKAEGNQGATSFTFTVTVDQPGVSGQTVDWSVSGTGAHAVDAADFGGILPSGTVSFAAGETSKTVTVVVSADTGVEFDEGFAVVLANPSIGLALGTASAGGTIHNDDTSIVSITASLAVRPEGDSGSTAFTFVVSLDQAGLAGQTVRWSLAGSGTHAGDASDFGGRLPSGLVSFAAGETSKTVTVLVTGDTVVEFDEGFTLTLSDASAGLMLGTATASGTIQNDDRSVVSIAALSAAQPEGNAGSTAYSFTISLDRAGATGQTIDWSVAGSGGHAATAADFGGVLPSGTVSFAAGEISKTVTVQVAGDTAVEFDEGFIVGLSNASAGLIVGAASAATTIQNDDRPVASIAALSASKAEGTGGMTTCSFTVTLDQAGTGPLTVSWAVTGASLHAANIFDFDAGTMSGMLSFAAGETSKTIAIDVLADTVPEFDESFVVTLANPSAGLLLGTASAMGTIGNDDGSVVSIAAPSAEKSEGTDGTTIFTFEVSLSQAAVTSQSVSWSLAGVGAHAADAADFAGMLPSGSLVFGAGQISRTIMISVASDAVVEFDEGFAVTLSSASAGLIMGAASASATIRNDDASVVSIAALSTVKAEGSGGATAFTFRVSLDQAGVMGQTVDWSVSGLTADAADFGGVLPSGTVSFAAGETSKTVVVSVAGDAVLESDEAFTVSLSNASTGLALGTVTASGAIANDDATAMIAALSAGRVEGQGGATVFTFTVTRSGNLASAQSVAYVVGGTGANPANAADFAGAALPSGVVMFAAGEASKTIVVSVAGDTAVETDETFEVSLSSLSDGLVVTTASAGATIVNDDASVSIAAQSADKAEGDAGTTSYTFTLIRSGDTTVAHSVAYAVTGTGPHPADAADFAGGMLPHGTVSFATNETVKTLVVTVAGDTVSGPDEGFAVSLANPSTGLVIGTGTATGTIVNDDLAARDDAYVILEGQTLHVEVGRGVLLNDDGTAPTTASLLAGPAHGTLALTSDGGFDYTPAAGFTGVDSFTYRASGANGDDDAEALVYVTPLTSGTTPTLDLLALSAEQQVAATYTAFFGRGADAAGFVFWVDQFQDGLSTQGPAALFANIASSFGISSEAKALYPFLADPQGASDAEIGHFLDSVYDNLFNRATDAAGAAYWTAAIKETLQAGMFVGSVLVDIIGGARDSAAGQDITTLMGKVAVALEYVQQQQEAGIPWSAANDGAFARALLDAVTADPQTVLVGLATADIGSLGEARP